MKWYEKFRAGQKVRVVKRVLYWRVCGGGTVSWNPDMDRTIGKSYQIKHIDEYGGYELYTEKDTKYKCNYYYPVESLACIVGTQLEFSFMSD